MRKDTTINSWSWKCWYLSSGVSLGNLSKVLTKKCFGIILWSPSLPKIWQLLPLLSAQRCPCGKAPPSLSFLISQEIYPGWFSHLYLHHLLQIPNGLLSALFFPISEEKVSSFLTGKCTIYVLISFTSTGTLIHSLTFSSLSSHTLFQLLLLLPSKY